MFPSANVPAQARSPQVSRVATITRFRHDHPANGGAMTVHPLTADEQTTLLDTYNAAGSGLATFRPDDAELCAGCAYRPVATKGAICEQCRSLEESGWFAGYSRPASLSSLLADALTVGVTLLALLGGAALLGILLAGSSLGF